jgi:hypothetical protein
MKFHSDTQNTFDILTKIITNDNINVVITSDAQITKTGCADIENSVLYVSQLIADQQHLMPGLILHEIGHFKYTPNEYIDIVLNIIEDGFIERKIAGDYRRIAKIFKSAI